MICGVHMTDQFYRLTALKTSIYRIYSSTYEEGKNGGQPELSEKLHQIFSSESVFVVFVCIMCGHSNDHSNSNDKHVVCCELLS